MTTEDDFQRALAANPDDAGTRLVFADWLQERGDPRAEGYRALGHNGIRPASRSWFNSDYGTWIRRAEFSYADLPADWFQQTTGQSNWSGAMRRDYDTRREAEDAAALAFAALPAARRAELLAVPALVPG